MKKIIFICIIFITLLLLPGCSNNNQKNSNYENTKINYTINNESNNSNSLNNDVSNTSNIVSTFTTKIYDKSLGRMHNLKLASKKLNNITLKSGEIFSFNDKLGPYNKNEGFQKGKIFSSTGNIFEEYGGGICQISTTLYNALLPLNVEILERHKHSRKVQYIQTGKDATVSYGRLDFKFKNILDYDIEFKCNIINNKVIIDIIKIQ